MEDLVTIQRVVPGREGAAGQSRDGIELIKQSLPFPFPGDLLTSQFTQGPKRQGGSPGSPSRKRGEYEETIGVVLSTWSQITKPITACRLPLLQWRIERRTHVLTANEDPHYDEKNKERREAATHRDDDSGPKSWLFKNF